jgi:hypothetical protein
VLVGLDPDVIEYLYGGLVEDEVLIARSAAVEFAAPMLEELCGGESQAEVRKPRRQHCRGSRPALEPPVAVARGLRSAPPRARVSGSSSAPVESSRAWPPHRPREYRLAHPTDTSRSNLAPALGPLSKP